jgi:HAD superfamily hydrolase (TIGR01509 family)
MIKNIVFDLGNVLLSWDPGEFLLKTGYDDETARHILNTVFRSQTWFSLDNGDISKEEAIEIMATASSLKRDEIASLFDLCTEIIFPISQNVKLLPELKKRGFNLYYLSNYPLEFFNETKKLHDFFNYFDGGIISAEVRKSKPDPEIYKAFLDICQLNPAECLYIDDLEVNVGAAEASGMKVIHFNNSESLELILIRLGLL